MTIEESVREITAEAPDGFMIAAVDVHGVVCCWDPAFGETKAGACAGILDDLGWGLKPCPAGKSCYCQE